MNNVSISGRLTKDPDVRTSASGTKFVTMTVAVNRGKDNEADFPRVVVFGKTAENCGKYLKKGKMVGVEGRIQTSRYQDRNGQTVYTTEIVANRVEFLSPKETTYEPVQNAEPF